MRFFPILSHFVGNLATYPLSSAVNCNEIMNRIIDLSRKKVYNTKKGDLLMNETFNVENPIKKNIDFAFKNLIFYVTASTQLDIYKEQKKNFEKVLAEINTILATYVNTESLVSIDEEKLQSIKFDLIDLDTETKSLKSYFAEWSLLWLEAIISLRMAEIKVGGVNNGR